MPDDGFRSSHQYIVAQLPAGHLMPLGKTPADDLQHQQ
jgi:hypothetical protein